MLEPQHMSPVELALWLKSELELEDLVDTLRLYYDDLPLPALRLMASFWMRVWPLWFERREVAR